MKKQGYNDRMDESLGMRDGKEAGKMQSMKDRRHESKGMMGHDRKPEAVKAMPMNMYDKKPCPNRGYDDKAYAYKY